jgi:hypothetical protein
MKSPDPTVRMFKWCPPWSRLLGLAGFGVMLIAFGCGVCLAGFALWDLGIWFVLPAVLVLALGGLLMLSGLMVFCFQYPCLILAHALGYSVILSVHADSLWIRESPLRDLFQKTVIVPFETIVWVGREGAAGQRGRIRIVHGPDLKTETVDEIGQADAEALLAILAERCPAAFTPQPLPGCRPSRN